MDRAEQMWEAAPCGGCGNSEPQKRCIGCLHDFGTPDSALVRKYTDALPLHDPAPLDAEVAGVVRRLRGTPLYEGHGEASDAPDEAADLIERLDRERGEYEAAFWEAEGKLSDAVARAEGAEAEVARLREVIIKITDWMDLE